MTDREARLERRLDWTLKRLRIALSAYGVREYVTRILAVKRAERRRAA